MLVDPQKTPQIRNFGWQQINYLRATINWNDPGITAGVKFARLPQNAFITAVQAHVVTAFNAVTTNPVSIGTTQANANELTTTPIAGQTAGYIAPASALGVAITNAAAVDLWAKYAPTGGGQSAGQVIVCIAYILDNDL
jgi:hypothetical protein